MGRDVLFWLVVFTRRPEIQIFSDMFERHLSIIGRLVELMIEHTPASESVRGRLPWLYPNETIIAMHTYPNLKTFAQLSSTDFFANNSNSPANCCN